jgi:OmpA-OmpF porin, OOP family
MSNRQFRSALLWVIGASLFAVQPAALSAETNRGLEAGRYLDSRIILAQRQTDDKDRHKRPHDRRGGAPSKHHPNRAAPGARAPFKQERRREVIEQHRSRPTERRHPVARPTVRTQERLRGSKEQQIRERQIKERQIKERQIKERQIRERQVREQQDKIRQRQRPSGEKREVDRDRAGRPRNVGETPRQSDWRERLTRWRERHKGARRRRFGDRKTTIVKKGHAIEVRRRRLDRNAGPARFIESRRYRIRNKRFRNRFHDGISIYARPPKGVRLDPGRYIVYSSGGSYETYLDTFLAPPLIALDRAYTIDEIVEDPEIRSYVRSVTLNTLYFELGSAEIPDLELKKLEDLARAMLEVIDRRPRYVFLLEGHTDATGSPETNLKLSEERAASVQLALVEEFGVPAENLKAVGYGAQYLEVDTEEAEERNRRVVVRGVGDLLTGRR